MVYETIRDIATGEELLLGIREPLQLQDMLGENTTEDRSDRETGEYPIEYPRKTFAIIFHYFIYQIFLRTRHWSLSLQIFQTIQKNYFNLF